MRLFGIAVVVLICLIFSTSAFAATWLVPSQCPTIQAGIDSASAGDTVLVAAGTYAGYGNRDLAFGGKDIVLKSVGGKEVTIIDAEGSDPDRHRCFYMVNTYESQALVIEGFTIRGGHHAAGGGMYCVRSDPTVRDCVFENNTAAYGHGGGVYFEYCSPVVENCTYTGNWSSNNGGGVYASQCEITIVHSMFEANHGVNGGGGVFLTGNIPGFPLVEWCDFVQNTSGAHGGGIQCSGYAKVKDCTFVGNWAEVGGGGVNCHSYFTDYPRVRRCTFTGNSTDGSGGGLNCGGRTKTTECTFV